MRWRQIEDTKHGNRQRQSADGVFKIVCITQFDGIPMKREYILWQWRNNSWQRVAESRSRKRLEKTAQLRAAQLEEDEE